MPLDNTFATYLLNIDDESFFAVYRNYLGPVQTPYHKHDLIQELHDFLIRPTTIDRIVALLRREDRVLLSAINVLAAPSEEQLSRFLSDEFEFSHLQALLLNHKDRLLVIDGQSAGTVRINPLLTTALREDGIGIDYLIGGEALSIDTTVTPPSPWLQPPLLAAFYAFFKEHPEPFTRSGALRKRTARALDEQFSTIQTGIEPVGAVRLVVGVAETLGLLFVDEANGLIQLRPDSWEALSELPERWIHMLIWSAALTSTIERTFEYAEILFSVVHSVPSDRSLSYGELTRVLQLSGNGLALPIDRETIDRLLRIGFFLAVSEEPGGPGDEERDDEDEPRLYLNPIVHTILSAAPLSGSVRVQANMEISVPPGTSFAETVQIARLCTLERYDTVPLYTLTEESVSEARRDGVENPLQMLENVVETVPQNVRFLLRRWESRSRAVRLLKGLIVTAEEEEASILRNTEEFTRLLREEIAPGVFLLHSEEAGTVEKVLSRLDIGSDPTVETRVSVDLTVPEYERYLMRYQKPKLGGTVAFSLAKKETNREETESSGSKSDLQNEAGIKNELATRLDELHLSEDARQELALRIERGLVLFPEQIRDDIVPQFGIEVRGLDYLGKIRMIEQAISNGDLLEVIMRSGAQTPQRVVVRPRGVVESGNDLMLRAVELPEDRAIKIRIRRISLLRRLSGTLISRNRKQ